MTPESTIKLIADLRAAEAKMTPGPWALWDSNSVRRFGSQATGAPVIEATKHPRDGVPDLYFRNQHDAAITILRNSILPLCDAAEHLMKEAEHLRGAIQAQDNRERAAGEKCGVPYEQCGCDWPDEVADRVLELQAELAALRSHT